MLDLLTELPETLGTTYFFNSHDLGVIHHMSDHTLVNQRAPGALGQYGAPAAGSSSWHVTDHNFSTRTSQKAEAS